MTQEKALAILKSNTNVFLTGEPGSGKTYIINQFTSWLSDNDIPFAVTASTGIAASHIDGTTIHSWCGIGILKKLEKEDVNAIRFHKYHYQRIVAAEVLILDEVSMLDSVFIDDLDKILRGVHGRNVPFGGIRVVMVGDFFQLPPVSRDGPVQFAFESESWKQANFTVCYLTEQHRQAEPIFTGILRSMRFGTMDDEQRQILTSRLGAGVSPTTLYTHNNDVDVMNAQELEKLPGKWTKYFMIESGDKYALAVLKKYCLSPEELVLKVGAVVMFTANRPDLGYMNGTIGIVERVGEEFPYIKLENGFKVYPALNEWKAYDEKRNVKATIKQLPVRLAWAITVHKSQGMSLDTASIDLSRAFEFGHGYVAISRVRSLDGLFLMGIHENAYKVNPKVLEQDKIFREQGV